MATNSGRKVSDTFKNLLNIDNSNSGIDGTLRDIQDGEGTVGALQLSTAGVKFTGTMAQGSSSISFGGNFSTSSTFSTVGAFSTSAAVTIGGAFITSGGHSLTLTTTGSTNVTLPTTGTIASTSNKLSAFAATTSSELAGVISDETGTGSLVFGSSPTIATPVIAQINDSNGNATLKLTGVASAVNQVTITNAITTASPQFSASGSDSDIALLFQVKGNAPYVFLGTATTSAKARFFEATSNGSNYISLEAPNSIASNVSVTLPSTAGTLAGRYETGTFTPTVTSSNGADTIPQYTQNSGRYTRIENLVRVDIALTGDGGNEGSGAGNLRIALPFAISASINNAVIPCGRLLNGANAVLLFTNLTASASYFELVFLDTVSTTPAVTPSTQSNTTRQILVTFTYEV